MMPSVKTCPKGKILNILTGRCIIDRTLPTMKNIQKLDGEEIKAVKSSRSRPPSPKNEHMQIDYTRIIITNLKMLMQIELKNKATFKVRAYANAIKHIGELGHPIYTIDDIGKIGKGTLERIVMIIKDGYTTDTKDTNINDNHKYIELFTNIMTIGNIKANELVEKYNITTIDELRKHPELLNNKQKMGLKYYDDFLLRIPRKEMDQHLEYISDAIKQHDPNMVFSIVGSYRRNAESSGDIDVLITHPDNDATKFKSILKYLTQTQYLVDDFAFGKEKYLGVSKIINCPFRRIDIMYMDPYRFPFAMLYFTGSKEFNVKLRVHALKLGYSLSEHGLKYMIGENKGKFVSDVQFADEKDIFAFLKVKYIEPCERTNYNSVQKIIPID
jgi:DNA polymerase beta